MAREIRTQRQSSVRVWIGCIVIVALGLCVYLIPADKKPSNGPKSNPSSTKTHSAGQNACAILLKPSKTCNQPTSPSVFALVFLAS